MSGLTDVIGPKLRRRLYAGYAATALALGATQVGYAAADAGQPTALTVALAVLAFVGTGLGLTAAANTPAPSDDD